MNHAAAGACAAFRAAMLEKVSAEVVPSLKSGASASCDDAVATAQGWRAGDGRLHWATYKATCRRHGMFRLDMNASLSDPILAAVSTRWERAFVADLRSELNRLRQAVRAGIKKAHQMFADALKRAAAPGNIDAVRGQQLESADAALTAAADWCVAHVNEKQKSMSRSITPFVQQRMIDGYDRAYAECGTGSHLRRCAIIEGHLAANRSSMFSEAVRPIETATIPLLKELVKKLEECDRQTAQDLRLTLSVFWEKPGVDTLGARLKLAPQLERILTGLTAL